jgi:CheY-like chemotaxis protein
MESMDAPGRLVLVVDDDAGTREAARYLLEDEGYAVDTAHDGAAALTRLRSTPAPALVLLDLRMPGTDGESFLRQLEEAADLPRVPVVVMTAASPSQQTSSLMYPLLRKPFGVEALLDLVTTYCPRLWDDEEPTTQQSKTLPARMLARGDTPRDACSKCPRIASARCTRCGEAFCRKCFDGGADGACPRCRRTAKA